MVIFGEKMTRRGIRIAMKRRRLLQKRQVVNTAKIQHKRRRQREIESQKAAIKEFFKM